MRLVKHHNNISHSIIPVSSPFSIKRNLNINSPGNLLLSSTKIFIPLHDSHYIRSIYNHHNYYPYSRTKTYNTKSSNLDTIYAVSTGVGTAISIIRVSGDQSYRVLQLLASNKMSNKETNINIIPQRQALLRCLYTPSSNKLIDKCILIYFPAKKSYNGEDIYELHVHGSKAVVSLIFEEFNKMGLRIAERGEFTKRAVMNGKITMRQAEAIDDLVKSDNQFTRQVAITNLLGKNESFLYDLKDSLIKILVNNEAYIDFQQDESDVSNELFSVNKIQAEKVLLKIDKLLNNYKNLQIRKNGINIAIVGKPNAGKSTLINCLSNKDIAIVSEQPGTTRDIIQTSLENSGITIHLYDTAGLRRATNKIEEQGIRRARMKMRESHYKLLLIDIQQEQTVIDKGKQQVSIKMKNILEVQQQNQSNINFNDTIFVLNKADKIDKVLNEYKFYLQIGRIKTEIQHIICAQNQEGIPNLLQQINVKILQQYPIYTQTSNQHQQIYLTRQRYFNKMQHCKQHLREYLREERPDIACQYLRNAVHEIGDIFGRIDSEDVLDVLFKEFCIGK